MIQSALLPVDSPFGNAITDAKASLAILRVIRDNQGFPNPDFNYTQSRHAAFGMFFWQTSEQLHVKYTVYDQLPF